MSLEEPVMRIDFMGRLKTMPHAKDGLQRICKNGQAFNGAKGEEGDEVKGKRWESERELAARERKWRKKRLGNELHLLE